MSDWDEIIISIDCARNLPLCAGVICSLLATFQQTNRAEQRVRVPENNGRWLQP